MKRHPLRRRRKRRPRRRLKFTPTAWAKLVWLRDQGPTEIGGFGIAPGDDPLLIEDIRLVQQQATATSVAFDDESVADLFDELVDAGLRPEQFARVWIHTHPGNCPNPSSVDEETFARVFGGCDWAVMFILARGGATYARLRFNAGPGGAMEIPVEVDFHQAFAGSDHRAWEDAYQQQVQAQEAYPLIAGGWGLDESTDPFQLLDGLDLYDEVDAELFMEMNHDTE